MACMQVNLTATYIGPEDPTVLAMEAAFAEGYPLPAGGNGPGGGGGGVSNSFLIFVEQVVAMHAKAFIGTHICSSTRNVEAAREAMGRISEVAGSGSGSGSGTSYPNYAFKEKD